MEAVRASKSPSYNHFKDHGLYGIEQRDDVYGLAMVNMIFRCDGNSHIYDGNCFDHTFWIRDGKVSYTMPEDDEPEGATKPFSRVLMNPPYKLRSNKETDFVDYGLREISSGGLLFAVLPYVVIGGSTYKAWRYELLRRHTVLACVKFDKNLFYPVSEATYGLIIRGHIPHNPTGQVFFGCLFDDVHRQRRSKIISDFNARDNVNRMTKDVCRFVQGRPVDVNIPREQKVASVDIRKDVDLSPETYLDTGPVKINSAKRTLSVITARRQVRTASIPETSMQTECAVFPVNTLISLALHLF